MQIIKKNNGLNLEPEQIYLPIFASIVMAGTLLLSTYLLNPVYSINVVTLFSLIISTFVYFILVILWGQLNLKLFIKKETKG